jgi:hypothetical protein
MADEFGKMWEEAVAACIKEMTIVGNFEVMFHYFEVVRHYSSRNYVRK